MVELFVGILKDGSDLIFYNTLMWARKNQNLNDLRKVSFVNKNIIFMRTFHDHETCDTTRKPSAIKSMFP